jgi:hypothetical protein
MAIRDWVLPRWNCRREHLISLQRVGSDTLVGLEILHAVRSDTTSTMRSMKSYIRFMLGQLVGIRRRRGKVRRVTTVRLRGRLVLHLMLNLMLVLHLMLDLMLVLHLMLNLMLDLVLNLMLVVHMRLIGRNTYTRRTNRAHGRRLWRCWRAGMELTHRDREVRLRLRHVLFVRIRWVVVVSCEPCRVRERARTQLMKVGFLRRKRWVDIHGSSVCKVDR